MLERKTLSVLLAITLLFIPVFKVAYPQEANQPGKDNAPVDLTEKLSADSIQQAIERAITITEERKEKSRAELESALKSKLDLTVQEWVRAAKKAKEAQLNKFLHRDWDNLNIGKVTYPVPFDFHLRSYDYSVAKADIFKTDSVIAPYRAEANIIETLYLEGYHAPDVSDVKQYYHTVTEPIAISLEYRGDKFIITKTERGPTYIERGWQKN